MGKTKAELQQEAKDLGLDPGALNKAELQEMIDNFNELEVTEDGDKEPNHMDAVSDPAPEPEKEEEISDVDLEGLKAVDSPFPEPTVDLNKLATRKTVQLIADYMNSNGQKGGVELSKLVISCVR